MSNPADESKIETDAKSELKEAPGEDHTVRTTFKNLKVDQDAATSIHPRGDQAASLGGAAPQEARDLTGLTIEGRYHVQEIVGRGGMSTVYRVKHVHLDKIFALKVMEGAVIEAETVQRFKLEAKASSMLNHPNIIHVQDFGIAPDGRPYMVMDYLEGRSLSDLIRKEREIDISRLIRIFVQICNALSHAHELGIVHRDIKSSNVVLITDDSGNEKAVVVDFGIAKILTGSSAGNQNLTQTGEVFGTPLYMSPEQCLGQPVDSRTDIYALGCVMYEMLTGRTPFQGDNPYQTFHKQIKEAPPPFPDRLRSTPKGRQMEAIVLKALAKSPQNRHKFVLELASELMRVEVAAGSAFGELRVLLKLLSGRMNAVERTTLAVTYATRFCTVLALVLALSLYVLPGRVLADAENIQRNASVMIQLEQLADQEGSTGDANEKSFDLVTKTLDSIAGLCRQDKQQLELFDNVNQRFEFAHSKTYDLVQNLKTVLTPMSFLSGNFDSVKAEVGPMIRAWAASSRAIGKLQAYTYHCYEDSMRSFNFYATLFLVLRGIACVLLVILAGLIVMAFKVRREKQDTGTFLPPGLMMEDRQA